MERKDCYKIFNNEIRVPVRGGYLRAIPAEDPDYPGIFVEFIKDNESDNIVTRPQVLVEQLNFAENKTGAIRALIWNNGDEDYDEEIKLCDALEVK